MDAQIFLLLAQDALTNSAIYVLLAMATILVFGVTRIIFIPQGEFVAYGALTLASLQGGILPGTVWLVMVLTLIASIMEAVSLQRLAAAREIPAAVAKIIFLPLIICAAAWYCAPLKLALGWQVLLTIFIVSTLGPLVYRVAFRPLADASVLILLIAAVAVHFALVGLGLLFFGAEGVRTPPFSDAQLNLGTVTFSGQSLWIYGISILLIVALAYFFGRTMYGKALRAVAFNRNGARLVGISPSLAGTLAFSLAAAIGCLSGILISPITTIYYDSGFLIGLKGFVCAIVGGLSSYPMAAGGALLVAVVETYSSFWLSAYKDVVVFTLIIPVLLWLSLKSVHFEEEE